MFETITLSSSPLIYCEINSFLNQIMPLDLILIERGGVHMFKYQQERNTIPILQPSQHLLRFWPLTTIHNQDSNYFSTIRERYWQAAIKGDLDLSTTNIAKFVNNSQQRLIGNKPQVDQIALLYDDYIDTGTTISSSIEDILKLGYKPNNIYKTDGEFVTHYKTNLGTNDFLFSNHTKKKVSPITLISSTTLFLNSNILLQ